MTEINAYPLHWPTSTPRTPNYKRTRSPFKVKPGAAQSHLLNEIRLLGGKNVILSTNIKIRIDGLPYANQRNPEDPAVCVYFDLNDKPRVFPCDLFDWPWKNMHAIGLTIKHLRGIGRYDIKMMEQAFTGFTALPSPEMSAALGWREAFGFEPSDRPTLADVKKKFRHQAKMHHPDKDGGNEHMFNAISAAWQQAKQELGGGGS